MSNLSELNKDMCINISQYLSGHEISKLSFTNKRFSQIFDKKYINDNFYQQININDWTDLIKKIEEGYKDIKIKLSVAPYKYFDNFRKCVVRVDERIIYFYLTCENAEITKGKEYQFLAFRTEMNGNIIDHYEFGQDPDEFWINFTNGSSYHSTWDREDNDIFDLELIYTTNEHDYYDCVDEEYCNYCQYCYWGYDKYIKHSYLMSNRDKAEWFLSK